MSTAKNKAEAYVRQHCPELMELSFGCELQAEDGKSILVTSENQYQSRTFLNLAHNRAYKFEKRNFEREFEIIGHPIQLQHWLRVLENNVWDNPSLESGELTVQAIRDIKNQVRFDLTTGQPATEADYQAFNDIVGI